MLRRNLLRRQSRKRIFQIEELAYTKANRYEKQNKQQNLRYNDKG